MIYKSKRSETKQKVKHPQLLILLESTEYQQEFYFTSELYFFLLRYSFLFSTNDKIQKNCDLKTNHFLVPQGNGENGARYLDPKYSRWISTDPALGEYVPYAGKSNEADKLPGMGGIFNSVNLSLYHYAGNNPVKYVDPDGKRSLTYSEKSYIEEILGNMGKLATSNAHVINIPSKNFDGRSCSTRLFYSKQIWLSDDIYFNPLETIKGKNALIHESFHQVQYMFENKGCTLVNGPDAFQNLLYEQALYNSGEIDVYSYGDYTLTDLSQYNNLSDIPYYESQAQMVGDFAQLYSLAKKGFLLSSEQIKALKESARILSNSGFKSEAIKWVKENID